MLGPGGYPLHQPGTLGPGGYPLHQPGILPLPKNLPPYNPEDDATKLKSAMKGLGTDENVIIKILCNRKNYQRQELKNYYTTKYGKDLIQELKAELSGKLEKGIIALFENPIDSDVKALHTAMKGIGTDTDTLTEIIATRPPQVLTQIKSKYKETYNIDLSQAIKNEISGTFEQVIEAMLNCERKEFTYPDIGICRTDAGLLYDAGEGKVGTDESVFIKILTTKSPVEIMYIAQFYQEKSGNTLVQAIEKEFSGNTEKALVSLVMAITNLPEFFARRIKKSMEGFGRNDDMLIRLLISRDEIDMEMVKKEYKRLYNEDMVNDIKKETCGDYEKFLIELISH